MSNYTPQWAADLIKNYENKVNTFYTNFNGLKSAKIHPSLNAQRNTLINRGNELNSKIVKAKQYFTTAKQWLTSLSGSFGLGFVPLVPAVIIAAIGGLTVLGVALTSYLVDLAKFSTLNESLIKSNATPEDIIKLKNSDNNVGFTASIGKIADLLAVGGAIYVVYKIMSKGK